MLGWNGVYWVMLGAMRFLICFFTGLSDTFLVAFASVVRFFVVCLRVSFLVAVFFVLKFLRAGFPVFISNCCASSRVSEAGSRSLGIFPLSLPSLM